MAELYSDPIIQKIIDIITAGVGANIKTYWHGDPFLIAKDDLPALLVSKDTTVIDDESNAEDFHRIALVLTLVTDIRAGLDQTPANIHAGYAPLYDIMEGRNADYTLKATAIFDILRKNHGLPNNAIIDLESPMVANYGYNFGKRAENALSFEANLSINIFFYQLRGNA